MSKMQQAITEQERQGSAWQGAPAHDYPESAPEGATLDLLLNAWLGKFTGGISPAALGNAYADWLSHLALAPSKQQTLLQEAWKKIARWQQYAVQSSLSGGAGAAPCIAPLPQDRRFEDPAWQRWPYNLVYQGFLLQQQWRLRVDPDQGRHGLAGLFGYCLGGAVEIPAHPRRRRIAAQRRTGVIQGLDAPRRFEVAHQVAIEVIQQPALHGVFVAAPLAALGDATFQFIGIQQVARGVAGAAFVGAYFHICHQFFLPAGWAGACSSLRISSIRARHLMS